MGLIEITGVKPKPIIPACFEDSARTDVKLLALTHACAEYCRVMAHLDTQGQGIDVKTCEPFASAVRRRWVEYRDMFKVPLEVGALEVKCRYDYARNEMVVDFDGLEKLRRWLGFE